MLRPSENMPHIFLTIYSRNGEQLFHVFVLLTHGSKLNFSYQTQRIYTQASATLQLT